MDSGLVQMVEVFSYIYDPPHLDRNSSFKKRVYIGF